MVCCFCLVVRSLKSDSDRIDYYSNSLKAKSYILIYVCMHIDNEHVKKSKSPKLKPITAINITWLYFSYDYKYVYSSIYVYGRVRVKPC